MATESVVIRTAFHLADALLIEASNLARATPGRRIPQDVRTARDLAHMAYTADVRARPVLTPEERAALVFPSRAKGDVARACVAGNWAAAEEAVKELHAMLLAAVAPEAA